MSAAHKLPLAEEWTDARPQTRADCVSAPRPCPWVSCRHHMLIHDIYDNGQIRINRATAESRKLDDTDPVFWSDDDVAAAIESLPHSCSLDAAILGRIRKEREVREVVEAESVADAVEQLALAIPQTPLPLQVGSVEVAASPSRGPDKTSNGIEEDACSMGTL